MCKPQKLLSQQTEIKDNFKFDFLGFYFDQHHYHFDTRKG